MQRIILAFIIFILGLNQLDGQLKNDTFSFRDDMTINYNLPVKTNDVGGDLLKIVDILKLGTNTNYSVTISSDSNLVSIFSTDINLLTGSFYYKTIGLGGSQDSALVYFEKKNITANVYPGDCNRDNLVNHFDLFPIGLMYGKYGNPRHIQDTNISFALPKKVSNWFFEVRGINGKHADVDGNGIVDSMDIKHMQRNIGLSKGNYSPIYSFASNDVKLEFSVADTISINGTTNKLSIPIVLRSPNKINAYGIGYSYTVRIYDPNTVAQSRFYPYVKYNKTNVWDEFSSFFVIDTTSYNEHTNIAYCRRNLSNGEMDPPQAGVIDVIIDDILLGISKPGENTHLNLYLKEVALIDNNYNTIPISPLSKRIYIRKATSSIIDETKDMIKIYPTIVRDVLTVENAYLKPISIVGYNVLGQIAFVKELKVGAGQFSLAELPVGIYYIRNTLNSEVVKIQKK